MTLEMARDLAIIIVGILLIVQIIVVIVMGLVVIGAVRGLKGSVEAILADAKTTTGTVAATSVVVADNVVKPIAKGIGFYFGARRALAVFFRLARPKGGKRT